MLNGSDADDILQEVAAVLWRKFAEYQPGSDFLRWACRIARLEVLAYHRHRKRLRTFLGDDVVDAVAEGVLELSETASARADALDDCVRHLVPRDRELLGLKYQSLQSVKEIAAAFGRTESAALQGPAAAFMTGCTTASKGNWQGATSDDVVPDGTRRVARIDRRACGSRYYPPSRRRG